MTVSLPDVLTIQETSRYLRIPMRSMYKLAQEGKIPCMKVGKHWRFRREAIEHWLESYPALVQEAHQAEAAKKSALLETV